MFSSQSADETDEINVRVVFYGPGLVGKTTLLQRIYDTTPEDQRGKMVSLETETERTVFFDLRRDDFPAIDGARLRLHLYTLSGQVSYAASSKLILQHVDAVVFVADAQRERREANVASFEELRANLSEQGLSLERVPHVVCVTKGDLENAAPLDAVASNLGSRAHALSVDGRSGRGVSELMDRLVSEIAQGVVEGRLEEWEPSDEEEQAAGELATRARLVGHYGEHFGETADEYDPAQPIEGRPGFVVVEHAPVPGRPYWTYATAGLSLWPQLPDGPEPRIELLAHSPVQSQAIVDVLMVLARQVHLLGETDAPYKTFDTVSLSGIGLPHEDFVFAPPLEPEALLDVPDVTFIQVVPVLPDELDFATKQGSPALLAKMDLAKRGKGFGWNRGPKESVVRKGFFGSLFR